MKSKLDYSKNKAILKSFYNKNGLSNVFEKDSVYLEEAFNEISRIWLDNYQKIDTVNYIMIAEAPLWGSKKSYIYNPKTKHTQFFYKSDLGDVLNKDITDKEEFIETCNAIGLLVIDISPFPLNSIDTAINYGKSVKRSKKLDMGQYQELVTQTIPTYFEPKIKLIADKKGESIKTFFRYKRVRNNFDDIIAEVLMKNEMIKSLNEIGDISQQGGGVDRGKLAEIII